MGQFVGKKTLASLGPRCVLRRCEIDVACPTVKASALNAWLAWAALASRGYARRLEVSAEPMLHQSLRFAVQVPASRHW